MAPDPKLAKFLFQLHHYMYAESLELMRVIRMSRLQMYRQLLRLLYNRQPHMAVSYFMGAEAGFKQQARSVRQIWMKQRSNHWWNVIAQTTFTNAQWKECFRIERTSFQKLCEKVIPHMGCSVGPFVREPIPNEKKVAIALYRLASGSQYKVVGDLFGVHKASVHNCVFKFCDALLQLKEDFIYLPSTAECKEIARRIEAKYGFPQVMGAIGATHIPILAPPKKKNDFLNRNLWASYILQAVVDDHYCFRDISCEVPGSAHDAIALKGSALMANEHMLPKEPVLIDGVLVPLMILGDPAYPLLEWLMKGYVGTNLTPEEESFNVYLSSACSMVEKAFGRLKARWKMLVKRIDVSYHAVPKITAACCILHNFCEMEKDVLHFHWKLDVEELQRLYPQPTCQPCSQGHNSTNNVRDTLRNYMAHKFDIRQSSYRHTESTPCSSEDDSE